MGIRIPAETGNGLHGAGLGDFFLEAAVAEDEGAPGLDRGDLDVDPLRRGNGAENGVDPTLDRLVVLGDEAFDDDELHRHVVLMAWIEQTRYPYERAAEQVVIVLARECSHHRSFGMLQRLAEIHRFKMRRPARLAPGDSGLRRAVERKDDAAGVGFRCVHAASRNYRCLVAGLNSPGDYGSGGGTRGRVWVGFIPHPPPGR